MEEHFCPLEPIVVTCKEHGPFMVTPLMHLVGYGCPVCDYLDPDALSDKLHNTFDKLMK